MATYQELGLYEGNDESLSLVLVEPDAGAAYDLTDATLEMLIKPTADTPDSDPAVVILSTGGGQIVIDDAAAGLATATVERVHLQTPGDLVWRLDVVRPGTRRTAVYGPLRITNL